MSPAAPEATNRASTAPRRDGVARLAGRDGEVATATGRTPRRSMQTWRRLPDGGPNRQAVVHNPGSSGARNRSGSGGVTTTRHQHWRVSMRRRRAVVGVALVAMVIVAGCSANRDSSGGGSSAGSEAQVAPAANQAMTEQDR